MFVTYTNIIPTEVFEKEGAGNILHKHLAEIFCSSALSMSHIHFILLSKLGAFFLNHILDGLFPQRDQELTFFENPFKTLSHIVMD